jgi:hypothetical protein
VSESERRETQTQRDVVGSRLLELPILRRGEVDWMTGARQYRIGMTGNPAPEGGSWDSLAAAEIRNAKAVTQALRTYVEDTEAREAPKTEEGRAIMADLRTILGIESPI